MAWVKGFRVDYSQQAVGVCRCRSRNGVAMNFVRYKVR